MFCMAKNCGRKPNVKVASVVQLGALLDPSIAQATGIVRYPKRTAIAEIARISKRRRGMKKRSRQII
jgi:hypothetical protein